MITLLRANNFSAIILIVFIFAIFKIPLYFFYETETLLQPLFFKNMPLSQFSSYVVGFWTAQLCIVIQAIWVNFIFRNSDLHSQPTLMPIYIFILLSSVFPSYNNFNFYHILIFIFLIVYTLLLSIYQKAKAKAEAFNIGFLFAIFTFLMPNGIVFLPFILIIFYIYKPFVLKELFIIIIGFLFFWIYVFSCIYLFDLPFNNILDFYFYVPKFINKNNYIAYIPTLLSMIYLCFSFISLRGIVHATSVKRKKNINVIVMLLIGFIVLITFTSKYFPNSFSLLIFPLSIYLSLMMLRIRKIRIAEILNLILVLTIFIVQLRAFIL